MPRSNASSLSLSTEPCLLRTIFDYYLESKHYLELYRLLTHNPVKRGAKLSVQYFEDLFVIDVGNGQPLILYEYTSAKGKKNKYSRNIHLPELAYANQRFIDLTVQLNKRGTAGVPNSIRNETKDIIPRIKPYVTILYSGTDKRPPHEIIDLSNFNNPEHRLEPNWIVNVINLNRGYNDSLLSIFKPLGEYMYVVNKMKMYMEVGNPVSVAARRTIDDCRKNDVLKELIGGYYLFVYTILIVEFENGPFI